MNDQIKDLVIIGGGPAGLSAGIYASRARLDAILLEKGTYGGQVLLTSHIENYPGFPDAVGGFDLADLLHRQAEKFGLKIEFLGVESITPEEGHLTLGTSEGSIRTKTAIIATGSIPNKLHVPGEEQFTGRGVSYCATCDGALYKDQKVAVVGGGDAAVEEAIFLTRFAEHVEIVHWMDHLQATAILQEEALANEKISIRWNTVVSEIKGEEALKELVLKNVESGETSSFSTDGLFIYIGITPQVEFAKGVVEMDERGSIVTDARMATSVPGLFAAGDVRSWSIRQVASAVGDGATAAWYAYNYLHGIK